MPTRMPEMLEPGNLNVPSAGRLERGTGLPAGTGMEQITAQDAALIRTLKQCFDSRPAADFSTWLSASSVIGLPLPVSTLDCFAPDEIGTLLDLEFSVQTRCGLHCAALIHSPIRCLSVSASKRQRAFMRYAPIECWSIQFDRSNSASC